MLTKDQLLGDGHGMLHRFCALNDIVEPALITYREGKPHFGVCAYYRNSEIHIWVRHCAYIGVAGRAWSAPGYTVDRTPYGVVAHELGHHVDGAHGSKGGRVAGLWHKLSGAEPISGYCPNVNEWFAEMFRLYITNPDLLRLVRPTVHMLMSNAWRPVELRTWDKVLAAYPRQLSAAHNKIRAAIGREP